jgi:hypothetical protein
MGISRRIAQITNGTFEVKAGSLSPALYRMQQAGWLTSSWGESETNRRAMALLRVLSKHTLTKNRAFSTVAVLTLALGIGAVRCSYDSGRLGPVGRGRVGSMLYPRTRRRKGRPDGLLEIRVTSRSPDF